MKTGDRVSFVGEGIVLSLTDAQIRIQFDGCKQVNQFHRTDEDVFTIIKPAPKIGDRVTGKVYSADQFDYTGTLVHICKDGRGLVVDADERVWRVKGFTHCDN